MLSLTKRRFVQLAGLGIANRILPGRLFPGLLRAQETPRRASNNVIIVTFGGGVRYAETFAPEGLSNIPHLVEMKPRGLFFRSCANAGVLSHYNSTASILTGNWQRVDDFGFQPPASPTIFEYYRTATGAGPTDAWAIATNKSFSMIGAGSGRDL